MMVEENIAENLIWRNRGKYVQRFKDATWNGLQRERESTLLLFEKDTLCSISQKAFVSTW